MLTSAGIRDTHLPLNSAPPPDPAAPRDSAVESQPRAGRGGAATLASGILFVCYANMCRSPMAEYIARDMLGRQLGAPRTPIAVASAGTHALTGHGMHPHAAEVAAGLGADPTAFHSRRLSTDVLAEAGLVLAATRRERAACVSLLPAAVHRTFTLRQFARLAAAARQTSNVDGRSGGAPPSDRDAAVRLAAAVAAAARARGRLQPVDPEEDDLADPIGQPMVAFRECAGQIEAALAPVMRLIVACG
ncbi:protein-tyrosine-phosphatase [Rugosimonospora acidiphila]|uniref:Protein-tyrosine-phosphatase n=1 Tax=Rugosimonospora acidiphila TaxID=556531 RepID=A0ABP9SM88_9ACTN